MTRSQEPTNDRPEARLTRRTMLAGFAGAAAAVCLVGKSSGSAWAAPTAAATAAAAALPSAAASLPAALQAVLAQWQGAPSAHTHIGDWRRVGYRRGQLSPRPTMPRVSPATFFGIRPNRLSDMAGRIQGALDAIGGQGGGVLLLQAGTYRLDSPIFVHDSNVVLRGAGKGRTILHFTRPIEATLGSTRSDAEPQSAWSWNGGQIFFIARDRLAKSQSFGWRVSGPNSGDEGWLGGNRLATISPAPRGSEVLTVDDASAVPVGEMLLLEVDNGPDRRLLQEIAGNVAGASTYDWPVRARVISSPPSINDFRTWRWPVKVVERISSTQVRIEQPLRVEIFAQTPARLLELGQTVHHSGVEGLTIENELIIQSAHNQNPGSNGVCFQAVYDCWARDIHVLNADLAFGMTSAKSCSLQGISAGGRSLHHFVACRSLSHDNLVEDFVLEQFTIPAVAGSYLHGINVEGLSSGNVYRRGTLHTGTFDSHRQMPFETLRTDITVTNKDSVPGGARDAGPFFGARTVHWDVAVTNNNNLGMEISDIAPRSLVAGMTGLSGRGSILPRIGQDFAGDLESLCLEFGTDISASPDLLDLQRAIAPIGR